MHNHNAHAREPQDFSKAFAIGIGLNLAFVLVEGFYGWKVNSLALLADAGHNLSDVAGLVLAWGGAMAGKLKADDRHTYGWRRGSVLAAFINAVLLLVAMGSLGWEAITRLGAPEATEGWTVIWVAAIGIGINTATALLFMRARGKDLNIRGAFLHMAADALVSVGVVVGGVLYLWKGWAWLDPVMSLGIAIVIVVGTASLFKQSLHLLFDGVPDDINLEDVRNLVLGLPGVAGIHDLHVWAMGTSQVALTAHIVVSSDASDNAALLAKAEHELDEHFEIRHVTLQVESVAYALHCAQQRNSCAA